MISNIFEVEHSKQNHKIHLHVELLACVELSRVFSTGFNGKSILVYVIALELDSTAVKKIQMISDCNSPQNL